MMFCKYYFTADCLGQNHIIKCGYPNLWFPAEFKTGSELWSRIARIRVTRESSSGLGLTYLTLISSLQLKACYVCYFHKKYES